MPDIFLVIGQGKTGKSTLIRALSGAYDSGPYHIEDSSSVNHRFFVQVRSLQEAGESPNNFISRMGSQNIDSILVALRDRGRNHPNGIQYITAFITAGWNIRGITVMGSGQITGLPHTCPQAIPVTNSTSRAPNEIASMIRQAWGWK